jgi:hypothetical protein
VTVVCRTTEGSPDAVKVNVTGFVPAGVPAGKCNVAGMSTPAGSPFDATDRDAVAGDALRPDGTVTDCVIVRVPGHCATDEPVSTTEVDDVGAVRRRRCSWG